MSAVVERSHPIRMTFEVPVSSGGRRRSRSRSRAIAGAADTARACPMIVATLINVATMSSSLAPASNARAIAPPPECFGSPDRTEGAEPDERVGPWARARRIERPARRALR